MKIETHCHTSEVSPCSHIPAADLVRLYAKAGYDALVVTDHFNQNVVERFAGRDGEKNVARYLLGYERALAAGREHGIAVFFGIETCLAGGHEDFLIYGVSPQFLYENPFLYELSQQEAYARVHAYGALFYQAHPYREPRCSPQNPAYLDGVEVFNAHPGHENHNDKALAFAAAHHLAQSAGSDCHEYEHVGRSGIVLPEAVRNGKELADYLRAQPAQLIRI